MRQVTTLDAPSILGLPASRLPVLARQLHEIDYWNVPIHPRYTVCFGCAIIPPGDVIRTRLENRSILQVLNPAYRRA